MATARVGLFLHDSDNDYQKLLLSDAEQAVRRHALALDVHTAGKDPDRQIAQIRAAIAAAPAVRPDLILVSPVREHLLLGLIGAAARAGVSWGFLNRWLEEITQLRREYPNVDIFSVSADQREIGRIQGSQWATLKLASDEILYISGPAGTSSARLRAQGIQPELASVRSRCQTLYGDWSQESGGIAATRWMAGLSRAKLSSVVIIGQNDNMAMGAREVMQKSLAPSGKSAPTDLRVIGCDGSFNFGQRLVIQGKLSATIVMPPVSGRAIEVLAQRLAGRGRPNAIEVVGVTSQPSLDALRSKYLRMRL